MKIKFPHSEFCVNEDGSGKTFVPGLGELPFDRASDTDNGTLLGSPFSVGMPSIGYDSKEARALANAEHEALHLWTMERLLHKASPNHCILIGDINSKECILWRTREELLVVGVQTYVNTGVITSCFRFVCDDVFGIDCDTFALEAAKQLLVFRAAFEAVIRTDQADCDKCKLERKC
jgi:hypothetical protein